MKLLLLLLSLFCDIFSILIFSKMRMDGFTNQTKELIVSRYNENLSWLSSIDTSEYHNIIM